MEIVAKRLRELRQSIKVSQIRMAQILETSQSALARYELGSAHVPEDMLLKYADYFDVSLDYIFGRTDKPQGKLYENHPVIQKVRPEMKQFVDMCFEPGSALSERLKDTILQMMEEEQKNGKE